MEKNRASHQEFETLRDSLRELPPTGQDGFEGLLCRLFSDLTGRRFFLSAAGSQHGLDLGTWGLGGTAMAIEAKKYLARTALDNAALKKSLVDLSRRSPRPDLWTIVASRPVSHQVLTDLRAVSNEFGIEVEVVDAPRDSPGDLDVLCAAFPETATQYLSDKIIPTLEELRGRPDFVKRVEALRARFCTPGLGFDHVRQAALNWFQEALSAKDEARARLGQPLDLLSPSIHYVRRESSDAALRRWWRSWEHNPRPFVLLGEEGTGKTWAAADWAQEHAKGASATILLFISSGNVTNATPGELVSKALEQVAGHRYVSHFWEKRLTNWFDRYERSFPQLLLVIDGINELPTLDWRRLFDRLRGAPWKDRVAVLTTCRPGFWRNEMLMPGQEPDAAVLKGFSDLELEEALRGHNHRLSDFVPALHSLLRKPRYLALAVKHYSRLKETGDFTLERLMYEDWKDRVERKSSLTLNDDQFRSLLRALASKYKESRVEFARRDIEDLLPQGASADVVEILTGGLMAVESGLGESYEIEHDWLMHSMGLLLASELHKSKVAEVEETLAHFLEPHLESDQQGDILAAAVLYALFTPSYKREAKHALLHAWISRQNHSQVSVDHLEAYVPVAYEDYLEVLEHSTLNRTLDHRAIERLEYALLAWRSLPNVEAALSAYSSRWLSFVHPEGFPYMRPQASRRKIETPGAPERGETLKRKIEERAGVPVSPGSSIQILQDAKLEVTNSDRFPWLADSALYFLSALHDDLRLKPLRCWALSRAVIGSPREWTQVAWLLRSPATGKFERNLLELVTPLLTDSLVTRCQAGAELLFCLGTPTAVSRIAKLPRVRRRIPRPFWDDRREDPCKRVLRGWCRQDCDKCSSREDLDDSFVAARLASHCLDPEFELPSVAAPRIKEALKAIDLSDVWSYRGRTSADGDLERAEPAVALSDPGSLVAAYRTVVRVQARSDEGWESLAYNLEHVLPLLGRERERSALRRRLEFLHRRVPEKGGQQVHQECDFFAALNANRPAAEQLEALHGRPSWAIHVPSLLNILQPMGQAELRRFLDELPKTEDQSLDRALFFLLSQPDLRLKERDRTFLCSLLSCGVQAPRDVPSRNLAIQIVLRSEDRVLLEKALDGRCLEPGDDVFFFERWPGERLVEIQTSLDYSVLRSGLSLATISYILSRSGRYGSDLSSFGEDVDALLQTEAKRRSNPFSPCFRVSFCVDYMRELVRGRDDLINGWVELAIRGDLDWSKVHFLKSTVCLFEPVCEALFLENDSRAGRLYLSLREATQQKEPGFQVRVGQNLPTVLFRVDVDEVRSHREEWFRTCGGDAALLSFATVARQYGREDFLFELVQEGLSSSRFYEQAKCLSLAGWCGGGRFRTLLKDFSVRSGSWLDSVREQALVRSAREEWARIWLKEFLGARGLAKSFAAFRLFLRCVDQRYWAWGPNVREAVSKRSVTGQRRLRFLVVNQREIDKAMDRNERGLEKSFLSLDIPTEHLFPWTGVPIDRGVLRGEQGGEQVGLGDP